ncbi:MAG: hypothetical protein ACTHJR_14515 [Sphingomonas sp.]|uniref:hypothetical protein n=1 Tax=Sphingomonas sp. TaxID=28214 RepID=UPI003F7DB364
MIWRGFVIAGIAFAGFTIGGCAQPSAASAIAPLSATDRAGNVTKIVRLTVQQCFDRASDFGGFEDGLKASGWPFTRTQRADPANSLSLDTWDVTNLTVIRGQTLKDKVWICSVMVKAPLAPSLASIRSALSKEAGVEPGPDGEWWWNRAPTRKLHMIAGGDGDRGENLFIHIETYRLPWWQGILG